MFKVAYFFLFICCVVFASKITKNKVGSNANPAKSCKDVKENGGTDNGLYYIKLGDQVLQVFCDQITAGGGWTLVYSYTFTEYLDFGNPHNAVTPYPASFPSSGDVRVSQIPPVSEIDYNAMDFNLWKKIGTEFMLKSNLVNWYACAEGTGSFVHWRSGSIKCRLVKNLTGRCLNVTPDTFTPGLTAVSGGASFYDSRLKTPTFNSLWYLNTFINDSDTPTHDSCGIDFPFPVRVPNPHGNVYVR